MSDTTTPIATPMLGTTIPSLPIEVALAASIVEGKRSTYDGCADPMAMAVEDARAMAAEVVAAHNRTQQVTEVLRSIFGHLQLALTTDDPLSLARILEANLSPSRPRPAEPMPPLPEAVLDGLDPGIRQVVEILRAAGVPTGDSGDGQSKLVGPMAESALRYPHVFAVVRKAEVEDTMDRARRALEKAGFGLDLMEPDAWAIQASITPFDDSAAVEIAGPRGPWACPEHGLAGITPGDGSGWDPRCGECSGRLVRREVDRDLATLACTTLVDAYDDSAKTESVEWSDIDRAVEQARIALGRKG